MFFQLRLSTIFSCIQECSVIPHNLSLGKKACVGFKVLIKVFKGENKTCRFWGVYIFCHLIFPLKLMGGSIPDTLPRGEIEILFEKHP